MKGTLNCDAQCQALGRAMWTNLFVRDVPITISRHVTTEDTKGSKAIVAKSLR